VIAPKNFLDSIDDRAVVAAIQSAERLTSAEIRLFVSHRPADDVLTTARQKFERLQMHTVGPRGAVMIFVAPVTQTFAVIGDATAHAACGQEFWEELAMILRTHFQKNDFTQGLTLAIERLGGELARKLPSKAGETNSRPDDVERE
jgi:uncharacterized membrane protein